MVKSRTRTVTARQQELVLDEIAQAKRRMGLPCKRRRGQLL